MTMCDEHTFSRMRLEALGGRVEARTRLNFIFILMACASWITALMYVNVCVDQIFIAVLINENIVAAYNASGLC